MYDLVIVTKYRRKVLNDAMLAQAQHILGQVLGKWRCSLVEFGGEADHVHVLFEAHPALDLSQLVNNLKTASSRRLRNLNKEHVQSFYQDAVLWHRAYYLGSVVGDGATLHQGAERRLTRHLSRRLCLGACCACSRP